MNPSTIGTILLICLVLLVEVRIKVRTDKVARRGRIVHARKV